MSDKMREALKCLLALHDNRVDAADAWNKTMEEARDALAEQPAQGEAVSVAYLAGALAMQEKIALAIEMSPRKSDQQVAQHIRASIKPVTTEQAKQWDDDARALLAASEVKP